ncbi:MAG: ABC transporter ATP-binding protein/permease, partial [Turicibacter sp.]|nr:ABC transporter ATP-binding protein/permease [Turicibacter sp.]
MRTEDSRQERTKFSLKQFIKLIKTARPKYYLLVFGILLLVFSSGIQVYVPQLASVLVNSFSKGIDYPLLIKVVILFVVSAMMSAVGGTILGIFGENIVQNLRKNIWLKLTTLKVKYFDTVKAGEISSRLVSDTSQVKELLATRFPQTLSSIILVLGSVYMMIRMDWQMCVAMLVAVPLVLVIMLPIFTALMKVGHMRQDALAEFNGLVSETLSEIRLVKTSNAEQQAQRRANKGIDKLFKVGKKEAIFDAAMQPLMMMVMMSMIFGLLAYGMHRIATNQMEIGILMSFLMYLFNLIGALPSIANLFAEMAKVAGSTKRVQDLLDEESEDFQSGAAVDLNGKVLKVENVNFSYDSKEPILTDVSFEAKPNQIIAFAGPSGSGKSTIFSLLERFYEPTSGTIQFGDIPIEDINLKNYRSQIGLVSQDSAIMAGTIRDNLTYGLDKTFSDEELWEVLELCGNPHNRPNGPAREGVGRVG